MYYINILKHQLDNAKTHEYNTLDELPVDIFRYIAVKFDVFVSEVFQVPMEYAIPKRNQRPYKSRLDTNSISFTITELYKL